jgi:hypothetical protein
MKAPIDQVYDFVIIAFIFMCCVFVASIARGMLP